MDKPGRNPLRIDLFSAPWPLFNRPSIQLGTLKSYLESKFAPVKVEAHHFYLTIAEAVGYPVYQAICEKTWPAESIYAALLFPEMAERAGALFRRESRKYRALKNISFEDLVGKVKSATDGYLDNLHMDESRLAGFSVCLCQMTSSLYAIRRLKERFPSLAVVVGGSNFAGPSAWDLVEVFPEVDFVVLGEGERPLAALVQGLMDDADGPSMADIAGVVSRMRRPEDEKACAFQQLDDLSELPIPDFSDYFQMLKGFEPEKRFFPTLLMEASRGCWWRRHHGAGRFKGCAFCNLNLQWEGYRPKKPEQVVREVTELTSRHQLLSVAFADNVLPPGETDGIFRGLADSGKDLRIFAEIRASTAHSVLQTMRDAGLEDVQIGIEALSTGLLKKMNKGTTAMDNFQIMRDCEELGIVNASNLLLRFPTSDEKDVDETLQALQFALPFQPLRMVFFWLGLGSPVHGAHKAFGIGKVFNHPHYSHLMPEGILSRMRFMVQGYRGDHGFQRKIWRPVEEAVRSWRKSYERMRGGGNRGPILSYRDGREFLIISQRREEGEPNVHRLAGSSRAIYLHCTTHRAWEDIAARFPHIPEPRLKSFLDMLVSKRLMYREGGRYLSLAVSAAGSLCRRSC